MNFIFFPELHSTHKDSTAKPRSTNKDSSARHTDKSMTSKPRTTHQDSSTKPRSTHDDSSKTSQNTVNQSFDLSKYLFKQNELQQQKQKDNVVNQAKVNLVEGKKNVGYAQRKVDKVFTFFSDKANML